MSAPGHTTWFAGAGVFLTVGIQLAVTVVVLFFLGRWLDERLGTSPWLMLAGLLLGGLNARCSMRMKTSVNLRRS